jgi:hypothetical protein
MVRWTSSVCVAAVATHQPVAPHLRHTTKEPRQRHEARDGGAAPRGLALLMRWRIGRSRRVERGEVDDHEDQLRFVRRWAVAGATLALPLWAAVLALHATSTTLAIAAVATILTIINLIVLNRRIGRASRGRR